MEEETLIIVKITTRREDWEGMLSRKACDRIADALGAVFADAIDEGYIDIKVEPVGRYKECLG